MKKKIDGTKRPVFKSSIYRMVAIIIALVLPINLLTLLLSNMVLVENQKQIASDIQNSLDWNVNNFATVIQNATKKLTSLSFSDSEFIALAKTSKTMSNTEKGASLNHISKTLKVVQSEYSWIDVVYFYFPDTDYLICTGYPGISYNACKDQIRHRISHEEELIYSRETAVIDDTSVLIGVSKWNDSYFGVLVNLERLFDKFDFLDDSNDKNIFFTNINGDVLTKHGQEFMSNQKTTLEEMGKSRRYDVYFASLPKSDLVLVEVIDWDEQMKNLPFVIFILQGLSILMAVLVIPLLLIYVRKWMIKPLNRLVKAINKIEHGEIDYRIRSAPEGREFEQINQSFNHMMDQVGSLKIDVYEKEIDRKNIKMQYLSQQIQSHFILNAMNIMYSYEPDEYDLIQQLILCISKYFQYIVRVDDDFVLLKMEMNHIQNYFEIQKARYPDSFHSIVAYEDDLAYALVPPLLVQNFVENSIKHSLTIGNKITISVVAEHYEAESGKPMFRICIADNGVGISDEILERIELFRKTREVQEGMGIGIRNAIERLEYLYFDYSKLSIGRNENGTGTKIEIILPLHYPDEQEGDESYASFACRR